MDKLVLKLLVGSLRSASGINGYCQNLLVGPMQKVSGVGVWIARLNSAAELQIEGESNVLGLQLLGIRVPLMGENPLSSAVRKREVHTTTKLPDDWVNGATLPPGLCYSAFPIQQDFLVRGAMMVGHSNEKDAKEFVHDLYEIMEALTVISFDFSRSDSSERTQHSPPIIKELSQRQLKVLRGISDGLTNYQIARIINLSESTVKQESIRIYRFLGVNNRQEATEAGIERGLLSAAPLAAAGD